MSQPSSHRWEAHRWWLKLCIQPVLFLAAGALFIVGLGQAQRSGWIAAGTSGAEGQTAAFDARFICPMMCTPPQNVAGRCPVCAMELVAASARTSDLDHQSVRIDAASRRVANIQTVAVTSAPLVRDIRAVGELSFNEGALKTLSAYVDGRLDRLYADYTGILVKEGDRLALVYSPRLYSSQVEVLLAKKTYGSQGSSSDTEKPRSDAHRELYNSARQRLIELGMTKTQLEQLEQSGEANSRMHLCAPISGTVIQKFAVEGQYVKEGQPIYTLADLTTVWLMLELFPEDAAAVRYGQKVQAVVQSLPGRTFEGRVAFIDLRVDPETRTVGVRVVVPNPDRLLRVGDYAKAVIETPVVVSENPPGRIYDPELASKWISPRHPHIIMDSAGICPECGSPLVPASQFGFTSTASAGDEALVVPYEAILMAGDHSVVYVETEPGRFELRPVVLGARCGDQIVVLRGVEEGEQVASRGNFLIDSQMQLAGNPSLIDPVKAERAREEASPVMLAGLDLLTPEDRLLAEAQGICPVANMPLGSMGKPPKLEVDGRWVFLCCRGCAGSLLADPATYLANLPSPEVDEEERVIQAALGELSPSDRELAERQGICPVANMPLGSMGTPEKVDVHGTYVFICCEGCRGSLLREPEKYLALLSEGGEEAPPSTEAGTETRPSRVAEAPGEVVR